MVQKQTVLVLGAGASKPYSFPTGSELRRQILAMSSSMEASIALGVDRRELAAFLDRFRLSERESIDSYLSQNPQAAEIGRRAIASVLLQAEHDCHQARRMYDDGNEQHWYRDLFNALTEHRAFADIDFTRLKVVTFNYDRSLENYLLVALENAYPDVTQEQVLEKLRSLSVVHVYGSLTSPLPADDAPYVAFGEEVSTSRVSIAARCIQVMPQGRDDAPEFQTARTWLREAEVIGILGFAFDELNLRRLQAKECLTNYHMRKFERTGQIGRVVRSTCWGLTHAQACKAASLCGIAPLSADGLPVGFLKVDCRTLLRETLLLS